MKDLLNSKKFRAAIAATIVALCAKAGLDLDEGAVLAIISPLLTYIVGQGVADFGKARAQVIVDSLEEAPRLAGDEIEEELRP